VLVTVGDGAPVDVGVGVIPGTHGLEVIHWVQDVYVKTPLDIKVVTV
jgi:hypothetical protein